MVRQRVIWVLAMVTTCSLDETMMIIISCREGVEWGKWWVQLGGRMLRLQEI